MTAASRERLENGISSVIHSSISIANEYVSECFVAETLLPSISSMAEYLTASPDAPVVVTVLSVTSSMILAIPKSQINGMALPACGQPVVRKPDVNAERTS